MGIPRTDTAASATPMNGQQSTRKNRIQNAFASPSPLKSPPLIPRVSYCTIGTMMDAALLIPVPVPVLGDGAVIVTVFVSG